MGGGGGGGVLCHLAVQTDFEFKISGPLLVGELIVYPWSGVCPSSVRRRRRPQFQT